MRKDESLSTLNEIGNRSHGTGSDSELILDRWQQARIDKRVAAASNDAEFTRLRHPLFASAVSHVTHSQRVITIAVSSSSVIIFTH